MNFDAQQYGPVVAAPLSAAPLAELGPGAADESQRAALAALDPAALVAPRKLENRDMARACLAGLWLRFDFLDESHRLSQDLASPTGSYWHGIMHRREGDFGNAKYWFRRVARHGVFDALGRDARRLAADSNLAEAGFLAEATTWDPFQFVDLCHEAVGSSSPLETLCREIQNREWELLFDACYRTASSD